MVAAPAASGDQPGVSPVMSLFRSIAAASLFAGAVLAPVSPVVAQSVPYQLEARSILERLVSYRTAEGQGQVPAMAGYIADTLRAAGIPDADIVTIPRGETVAMIVRIPGSDANARPIMFSAHMDVVDARPEDWERSPFTLVEENGFFYGRGVGDNKTGVTALVSTVLRLKADGVRPRRTLLFAFVGNEETEGTSAGDIATHAWVRGAEFVVNTDAGGGQLSPEGRPLIYFVQGAEKTFATFRITARNPGGHSSVPRPDNAIYDLSRGLLALEAHQFPVMANDLTRSYFAAVGQVETGAIAPMLRRFAANPQDAEALAAIRADPEYANKLATTCVATMLNAGHAENALPQRAEALVNCRIFPGVPVADVAVELTRTINNPALTVEVTGNPSESSISEMRPDLTAAITRSIHARYPGVTITPSLSAGATDGLFYRANGLPTYGTGGNFSVPGEEFAHGLNEKIRTEGFYAAIEHIHDLAVELGR